MSKVTYDTIHLAMDTADFMRGAAVEIDRAVLDGRMRDLTGEQFIECASALQQVMDDIEKVMSTCTRQR